MKKFVIAAVMAVVGMCAWAQDLSLEQAIKRIDQLEKLTQEQAAQINQLNADFQELTNKHRAILKRAHLEPVKSKAKLRDMEYRLIDVVGDPTTRDVKIKLQAINNGTEPLQRYFCGDYRISDENGTSYNEKCKVNVEGENKYENEKIVYIYPNAPLILNLTISGVRPETQYIKNLAVDICDAAIHEWMTFENQQIDWVKED